VTTKHRHCRLLSEYTMVLEISSEAEFNKEIKVPGLVVVDFFTTWCGPCKMIAPIVEEFSRKYPSVKFIKVDTERNPFSGGLGIRSIPTFFFYVGGNKVEEMMGANPQMLEQKVLQYKTDAVSSFGGSGVTLGTAAPSWDGIGLPPGDNARAARLKAFGALDQKSAGPKAVTDSKPAASIVEIGKISMEVDDDEALAKALQLSQATDKGTQDALDDAEARAAIEAEMASEGNTGDQDWGEDMVPVPVDESILRELGEMGFEEVRARKAIVHGKNIDGALSWLDAHQDDADIDLPYMVRKQDIKVCTSMAF
jgi:thioredoxin 1